MESEQAIRKQYTALRVIILAMLVAAPLAYTFIVYTMIKGDIRPLNPDSSIIYAMFALAILSASAIPIFERLDLWKTIGRNQRQQGMGTLQSAHVLVVIRLAFIESIYIYGLVTFFVSRLTTYLPYFAAIGVLCSILYWPTYDRFATLVKTLEEP